MIPRHAPSRRPAARLAVVLSTLLLTACSLVPKAESPSVYLLPATPGAPANAAGAPAPLPLTLRVATPYSGAILDSTRIMVVPEGTTQIQAYAGARWSDRAPALLRDRLVDVLRERNGFRDVAGARNNARADLELRSELLAYQVEHPAGRPTVHIVLQASLVALDSNRIQAGRRFEVSRVARDRRMPEVVDAFGAASGELAGQVAEWARSEAGRLRPSG
ncbi:ABC-type transport auxiliary lipoprotein family protein [Parapusillimonas granuli]|uniref:Membrane integrity-associated transporter subunit PqiC n=1 Tax=Parapusillimonas granuli TaxID=380911 RepID=A0A853FYJ6_9BURK|nr:ABC-type transport auxiliary lipoprotein family protein [Parapusillimonas granuli]MBB5214850.1 cholesterol transport system auxiliary component [Parapusillimonas granuli]MEB2397902.1 ABC-type transport auxiliary lipoprotein family protein [Alcaligenaceae bacterium]NYT48742.1 membrane integrity-associated transporter subunit PqiC [Parapusillimonas granuli]